MAKQDDITLHNYQDDLDTEPDQIDSFTEEQTDDPTKELNIPPEELKTELDRLDPARGEDARESVEDLDDEQGGRNN